MSCRQVLAPISCLLLISRDGFRDSANSPLQGSELKFLLETIISSILSKPSSIARIFWCIAACPVLWHRGNSGRGALCPPFHRWRIASEQDCKHLKPLFRAQSNACILRSSLPLCPLYIKPIVLRNKYCSCGFFLSMIRELWASF